MEKVSGNTIYTAIGDLYNFGVEKNVRVKNLILTGYQGYEGADLNMIIKKGAKIKNVYYMFADGTKVKWDKKNRTLAFSEVGASYDESADLTFTFDKSGRITEFFEDYESLPDKDFIFTYYTKGDYTGFISTGEVYSFFDGEKKLEQTAEMFYENDLYKAKVTTYDEDMIPSVSEELSEFKYAVYPLKHEFKEGGDIVQTAESTYDEKDRLLKSVVTEGDRIYTDEYSYDEKGYLLKIISTDSAYPGEISYYEYTYDKKGNNTFRKVTDYDGSVSTTTIKYDKYGVWTEMDWVKTDGTVEHYTNT